jgi:hypothetical protein
MSDTLAALAAASAGLLVPSESDYPFEPFEWPGPGPLTPAALLAHLGLPPDTPVETRDVERFLGRLARRQSWMDAAARASAARFGALQRLFRERLSDVTVYRVGQVEVQVFTVGRDADGRYVGLRTTQIET